MGNKLEEIILKYSLLIHNDGVSTYNSGNSSSAPDVTLSTGILKYGKFHWSVIYDDLRSPHDPILIEIGTRIKSERKVVINWRDFVWQLYEESTSKHLSSLCEKWITVNSDDVELIASELSDCIKLSVDAVATKKVISDHSRPWINSVISEQLKLLRNTKRKCRLRKSPANVALLCKVQKDTVEIIRKAKEEWWLSECQSLIHAPEKQKWKIIDRLTNQSQASGLQPIKRIENGETVYVFGDDDIIHELQNHHICKNEYCSNYDHSDSHLLSLIANFTQSAKAGFGSSIMNAEITDTEVTRTFSKGSDTPGPDGISSSLIDKADRELMHLCLKFLWNKAWMQGCFPKLWKQENRVVIPKPGKDDYNECSSYRTISITPCIGKCFEYITSQRLASVLYSHNFDPYQFAYLRNRSCTQAAMLVVEKIQQSLIRGNKAGAIFFDFSDAFGSVNRNRLLYKIANDFGITGKLFLHIQSFLNDRSARIKMCGITGDWIDSVFGTSAGTSLGPLLFIVHIHDIPKCIFPSLLMMLFLFQLILI